MHLPFISELFSDKAKLCIDLAALSSHYTALIAAGQYNRFMNMRSVRGLPFRWFGFMRCNDFQEIEFFIDWALINGSRTVPYAFLELLILCRHMKWWYGLAAIGSVWMRCYLYLQPHITANLRYPSHRIYLHLVELRHIQNTRHKSHHPITDRRMPQCFILLGSSVVFSWDSSLKHFKLKLLWDSPNPWSPMVRCPNGWL